MTRERWMALCFAVGAACFLVGPFPGYAGLVGDRADAITFFVGSILFTVGAACRAWSPIPSVARAPPGGPHGGRRRSSPPGPCSSTSRPFKPCPRRCPAPNTTSSCGAPMRWARSASSSPASSPTTPRRDTAGCPCAVAGDGGSRRSICWAACSSGSAPSPATWCPTLAQCSIRHGRTGTPGSERRVSWPARCSRSGPVVPPSLRVCNGCVDSSMR